MVDPEPHPIATPPHKLGRDLFMVFLAVLSIVILVYDELRRPTGMFRWALVLADLAIVCVFIGEFAVRLHRAERKGAFLRRTWYEIPGMVPMIVGELGFLRFFRLFRIVAVSARLFRANRVAQTFFARSHLVNILGITFLLLFGGAYAEWLLERDGPNGEMFETFGDSLWWAIVTTTTVGYGDKFPATIGGRLVASVLMLTGIGLIGTLAATVSSALLRPTDHAPPAASRPLDERLAAIAKLHAEGALTDEEFQRAKDRLLHEP